MMADARTTKPVEGSGTELVCFAVEAEPLRPLVTVRHDASYVTQLIANAADLPNHLKRRSTDKAVPLAAYAPAPFGIGRTRRIV